MERGEAEVFLNIHKKRGLSPIIATVLLIALVLILILIIFTWSRGLISENIQKFGSSAKITCEKVDLEISSLENPAGGAVDLQIVNRGDVPVYQLEVAVISGGNSKQSTYEVSVTVGGSASLTIPRTSGQELVVYPVILGSVSGKSVNKAYTCLDNGEKIN